MKNKTEVPTDNTGEEEYNYGYLKEGDIEWFEVAEGTLGPFMYIGDGIFVPFNEQQQD